MTTVPEYLPLTPALEDLLVTLGALGAQYASPQTISRARKFGLIEGTGKDIGYSALGKVVAEVAEEHRHSTGYAHPGRIGVKGRCRCGEWSWHTNEGGADGKRRVRNAFSEHLAAEIAKRLPADG